MDSKTENSRSLKHRRSIRLKNYDYSWPGLYFITICTHDHIKLLGEIIDERMNLSKYGAIAEREWYKTIEIRPKIILHEFVIMPNHLHGIIEITCRGTKHRAPTVEKYGKPSSNTIPTIIRSYKAAVTKQVREIGNNTDYLFWQRGYYEHIIRNEESYLKIAEYISNNHKKWHEDKYYNGKGI